MLYIISKARAWALFHVLCNTFEFWSDQRDRSFDYEASFFFNVHSYDLHPLHEEFLSDIIRACEWRANWGRSVIKQEFSDQKRREKELAELSTWQWMPTAEPPPCGITGGWPRLRHSPPSFSPAPPSLCLSSDWSTEITLREWAWQSDRITEHVTEWHTEGQETKKHFSFSSLPHIFSLIYASFSAMDTHCEFVSLRQLWRKSCLQSFQALDFTVKDKVSY